MERSLNQSKLSNVSGQNTATFCVNSKKPKRLFYSSLDRAFNKRKKQFKKWLEKTNDIHGAPKRKTVRMKKSNSNPIISPINHHSWESIQTFNAAATYTDGKVHFFYRALGDDYVSRIGYATSRDGLTVDKRLAYPVYNVMIHHEEDLEVLKHHDVEYDKYSSGGGWAGCEDPRVTIVDDRVYMLYVAFDGYSLPRVAITSLEISDLHKQNWDWTPAQIISPPGVVDKSGVLFPEKIHGKYVIMHRIFPDILIDYVDTLDFPKGTYLKGEHRISIRDGYWDSRKIGAGAPPLKTKYGWLLLYYGVDDRDASQYKMGAMLLDINDPAKVLYRTDEPIIEPTDWYENEGHKAGIIYPCGAVIIDDKLYVYYGGADTVVCVAYANIDIFLTRLMHNERPKLSTVSQKLSNVFNKFIRLKSVRQ